MEIVLVLAVAISNIACFIIGARVGQQASKGQPVEPVRNPVTVVTEIAAKKEEQRQQDRLAVILDNIEIYDGTSAGQREVPRG